MAQAVVAEEVVEVAKNVAEVVADVEEMAYQKSIKVGRTGRKAPRVVNSVDTAKVSGGENVLKCVVSWTTPGSNMQPLKKK